MRMVKVVPVTTPEQVQTITNNLSWFVPKQALFDDLIKGHKVSIHLQWINEAVEVETLKLKECET